jgi:glycosyltransferase involved in cell wall biosynthesis
MIYFSCIVTCFNREDTIVRSLISILTQEYEFFEIIVVDDNSSDNSIKVIESLKSDKIRIIRHDVNLGQNAALNTGVKSAKYDFLAFLDSDDFWLPKYLLEMAKVYNSNPEIGFVYCSINSKSSPLWTLEGENKYADTLDQGFLSSMISITAKKECVLSIGLFDLKYRMCQDDDFCFRLAKEFSFSVIKQRLAQIGGAANSMTRNREELSKGWIFLFENYKNDIIQYCGYKTYSKHMLMVAIQLAQSKNILLSIKYYIKSIYFYFRKGPNYFQFEKSLFYKLTLTLLITLINLKQIKKWFRKLYLMI